MSAVPGRWPTGLSVVVAFVGGAGLTLVLGLLGELRAGWFAAVVLAGAAAALGARSRPVAALPVGLVAWLFHNGFVEHRHAELGWNGWTAESARLALFAGAALLASVLGSGPGRKLRTRLLPRL